MIKKLYEEILTVLQDDDDNLMGLKHIDLYTDQLEAEKSGRSDVTAWPAAFIRFNPARTTELGEQRQIAEVTFIVIHATKNLSRTSSRAKGQDFSTAMNHFERDEEIYKKLTGHQNDSKGIGTITRISVEPIEDIQKLTVTGHVYQCAVIIDKAEKSYVAKSGVSLNVTFEDL